jgi:hypothetical protein
LKATKPNWVELLGTKSVQVTESLIDTFKRFKLLDPIWSKCVDENNFVIKGATMEIENRELQSQSN